MKYRKKPVVIEAILWDGDKEKVNDFMGLTDNHKTANHGFAQEKVFIQTLEGVVTASMGDYIIKGVKGEFYPCKPDIFKETYEEVTDELERVS